MVLRLLCLACLISVPLPTLSQESGKAKPRVPVTKRPEAVSKIGIIYVVGDVHRPMGVSMEDTGPITVLKALATAEGANATAGLHHSKIFRKGGNGTSEIPLDITQIMQAKAPDVMLQADDILFVPSSAGKSARKPQYYDAPPSDPMQGPTPIYTR